MNATITLTAKDLEEALLERVVQEIGIGDTQEAIDAFLAEKQP